LEVIITEVKTGLFATMNRI